MFRIFAKYVEYVKYVKFNKVNRNSNYTKILKNVIIPWVTQYLIPCIIQLS